MRDRIRRLFAGLLPAAPDPSVSAAIADATRTQTEQHRRAQAEAELRARLQALEDDAVVFKDADNQQRQAYVLRCHELAEARQMAGAGPWLVHESRGAAPSGQSVSVRESDWSQGASGYLDLMLENIEWRRDINYSQLEFSRWGIQQIMLICRLYYIKNPIFRRLTNVCAAYVFARDVEVSSSDKAANQALDDFFADNKETFGHVALMDLERRKDYDGNLFFVFFPDRKSTGKIKARTFDALEIQEIVCNPDDSDEPWLYRRTWTQNSFDVAKGAASTQTREAWYPALGYDPVDKPPKSGTVDIMWDTPVLHRRCGAVAKWKYGCPRGYPALAWCRESKELLESIASVKHALAQIARTITTKGGQQALMGIKAQLQTLVGTPNSVWDTNPPAGAGSTFAAGTGTELKAFQQRGAADNPDEVYQFELFACMVWGVPITFLGDVKTGNLATATSLDRPTETVMLEKQEEWQEDLSTIAKFVLGVSAAAPSGRLKEAHRGAASRLVIREAAYTRDRTGRRIYSEVAAPVGTIDVKVTFPAIREGDMPAIVGAIVAAMTLGNRGGQIVGIDEKAGIEKLHEAVGIEDGQEIAEQMFPAYDPDRSKQVLEPPVAKVTLRPGGTPVDQTTVQQTEAALDRLREALRKPPGHATEP